MTHEEILQQKRVCYAFMHIILLHMYISNCVLSSMDQNVYIYKIVTCIQIKIVLPFAFIWQP